VVDVSLGDARLPTGARVEVDGVPARVVWLGGRFHKLRIAAARALAAGDAILVTEEGGAAHPGVVLDPAAERHGPSRELTARLTALAQRS